MNTRVEHPAGESAHRRMPDGTIQYWSEYEGAWVDGPGCQGCLPLYPVVTLAATWAEPIK